MCSACGRLFGTGLAFGLLTYYLAGYGSVSLMGSDTMLQGRRNGLSSHLAPPLTHLADIKGPADPSRPHSLLWFSHVPKTGGTTLSLRLAASFDDDEILPGSGISCPFDMQAVQNSRDPTRATRARIAFSHDRPAAVQRIAAKLGRKVIVLSLLRGVVRHRMSYFRNKVKAKIPMFCDCIDAACRKTEPARCRRRRKDMKFTSAKDWIKSPHYSRFMSNFQLLRLAGCSAGGRGGSAMARPCLSAADSDKTQNMQLLKRVAMNHLASSPWFGVLEYMNASVCLFGLTFRRMLRPLPPVRVHASPYAADDGWTHATVASLRTKERHEIEVFEFAKDLIRKRERAGLAEARRALKLGGKTAVDSWLCPQWAEVLGVSSTGDSGQYDQHDQHDQHDQLPRHLESYSCGNGLASETLATLKAAQNA